jgi:hypothetical protein
MYVINILVGLILSYIGGVIIATFGIIIVLAVYSKVKNMSADEFDYDALIKTASIIGAIIGIIIFLSGGYK